MSSKSRSSIHLKPLGKRAMAQLIVKARETGVAPEDYATRLVQDALTMQREAESMTFAQIMEPVRKVAGAVDEAEIVRLVNNARVDYYASSQRRRAR